MFQQRINGVYSKPMGTCVHNVLNVGMSNLLDTWCHNIFEAHSLSSPYSMDVNMNNHVQFKDMLCLEPFNHIFGMANDDDDHIYIYIYIYNI